MSQINSNTKDDFQVVLLLSCFVGHPVYSVGGESPYGGRMNDHLFDGRSFCIGRIGIICRLHLEFYHVDVTPVSRISKKKCASDLHML